MAIENLPVARFKERPEDFVVEELPAYDPSGAGEHLYVTLRKVGRTTPEAVASLCRALGADPRQAGWAGMKDKHAVTTQTVSIQVPIATDPAPLLAQLTDPGIEVLSAARHGNKLKPGHLAGNRFRILLRGLDADATAQVRARLEALAATGAPNHFGPQRFGRDGDNPERALAWLAGKDRGPRDRRDQRFWFSSLQSLLFDDLLARRLDAGTWCTVLAGDLAKKHDSGGLFLVPSDGPELDDAVARAKEGALSATGPMFGASMRWPEGAPAELEREVLAARGVGLERLAAFRALGEGTRRPLRMMVSALTIDVEPEGLRVGFVLPKGGYATTLLGRCCMLAEPTRSRHADPSEPPPPGAPEPG